MGKWSSCKINAYNVLSTQITNFFQKLNNSPSQEVIHAAALKQKVSLFFKRDDLLHPIVSGNKARKLKYNLLQANQLGKSNIVTVGGAFSNHLLATAFAAHQCGFTSKAYVRGEASSAQNPTLSACAKFGMQLEFVSRTFFRNEKDNISIEERDYFVPEGGSSRLACEGVAEVIDEIQNDTNHLQPNYIICACGTSSTYSGLVLGADKFGLDAEVIGVPVLKGNFHRDTILQNHQEWGINLHRAPKLWEGFHGGGYAKADKKLIDFINQFRLETGIPLDPIYTGKLVFAVFEMMQNNFFQEGDRILIYHSGGLQGIDGWNLRYRDQPDLIIQNELRL
ncbi:MAG: 1-aminocyclopropane-1-carboxylate deaminase/D-cysteine desulfhydrase [Saprospiraceae bacterium]|nr:1-aminocyclopropane-1-carboxylate deaminase/D-cysteine desulfhydrase [Saprospiraceae bacterium]